MPYLILFNAVQMMKMQQKDVQRSIQKKKRKDVEQFIWFIF